MSKEAAVAFRDLVRTRPELENEIRSEYLQHGSVDTTVVARRHGFEFTAAEADAVWNDVELGGDELSDFELEMVSGGGKYPCNTDDSRFAADSNNRAMDRGANDA